MTTATAVTTAEIRRLVTEMFGGSFGNHPGCLVEQTKTAQGGSDRLEITFTRRWTYVDGVFRSEFGHMPDATCTYDWWGGFKENRHRFVMTVRIECEADGPYKVDVIHYWRPVHSLWGHIKAHFRCKWYLFPWRILTLLFSDFRTGIQYLTTDIGEFDSHVDALEAARMPDLGSMPAALSEMLTS